MDQPKKSKWMSSYSRMTEATQRFFELITHLDSQQNASQSGIDFFQPRPNGISFFAVILEERKLHFRFFGPHCCHFCDTSSELRFHCLSQRCVAELSTWKSCTNRRNDKDCSDGQLCMLQSCGTVRRMVAFLFWSLQKPLEVTMVHWQSHS